MLTHSPLKSGIITIPLLRGGLVGLGLTGACFCLVERKSIKQIDFSHNRKSGIVKHCPYIVKNKNMEKQIKFKNKIINFTAKGEGKTIVFLHGFLESLEIWDTFSKKLSKKFRVICIDLPGHGETENISETHSMELMADVVKSVLDDQGVETCIMVGHSMGGYVTLAFAEKYQEMLNGICLFHSAAHADSEEAKTNRDRTIRAVSNDHTGFIQSFIPDLFANSSIAKFKKEIDLLKKQASKTQKEGIIAALKGMKSRTDKLGLLEKIPFPLLMIIGKKDSRIPVELALQQVKLPSHGEALILGNVGHMGYIEAKKITLSAVRDFAKKY